MKRKESVAVCAKQKKSVRKSESQSSAIQEDREIISFDELNRRGGIIENKNEYLIMHLTLLHNETIHLHPKKSLVKLTEIIYRERILYVPAHGGYTLMKFSSIHTELRALSQEVKEMVEQKK